MDEQAALENAIGRVKAMGCFTENTNSLCAYILNHHLTASTLQQFPNIAGCQDYLFFKSLQT